MQSIFKEVHRSLTINEADVKFQFTGQYLRRISLTSNKVLEMRGNELLKVDRLCEYTSITLIRDHQSLTIPIVRNSWKYGGRQGNLLSFEIPKEHRLSMKTLKTWHREKYEKQPNE